MEWNEFKTAVRTAVEANDQQELKHLEYLDGRWFEDAIEELEKSKVKVGDSVMVQGNKGTVLEVIKKDELTFVRVHFTGHLAEYGQYQDQVFGGFTLVEET